MPPVVKLPGEGSLVRERQLGVKMRHFVIVQGKVKALLHREN